MRFIPAIAWLILITILFLIPSAELPEEDWFEKIYLDKWVHAGFFFLLVWLFYIPLRTKAKKTMILIAVIAMIYGIVIELLQEFAVAGRTLDVLDMVFDGIGSMLAYFTGRKYLKK